MRALAGPALLAVLAAAAGCASPEAPPGGEPDQTPPRLVSVTPEPYAVTEPFDEPVVFEFDERLSERLQGVRRLDEAVIVSPETGVVDVERSGREVKVSLSSGWSPGHVYRIELRPVLSDLFGNVVQEPVELVFSTGPPIPETALAGIVSDRITGAAAPDVRVAATRRADSVTYVAITDTAGFFAMRFVPAGAYDVRAFQDRNRDRAADFGEPRDSAEAVLAVNDTALLAMAILPGDSTPARLLRAREPAPRRVRLVFDDYFDPYAPVDGTARIFRMPDSVAVGGGELVHSHTIDDVDPGADAETMPTDTAVAGRDTTGGGVAPDLPPGAVPDLGVPADTAGPGEPAPTQQPAQPLPSQELVLIPADSLVPGAAYVVEVDGVANIAGVPGGGGAIAFVLPEPPADTTTADTVPPDTVPEIAPDTVPPAAPDLAAPDMAPPDTAPPDTVPSDTVLPEPVPPDTVPPDTVPPDTAPPDTRPPDTGAAPNKGRVPGREAGSVRR